MSTHSPSHEEISRRAQQIWNDRGQPEGRDNEIWLEAEKQLSAGSTASNSGSDRGSNENSRTVSESKGAAALAERVKSETAAESIVENHISPAVPQDDAIKAAVQKKEARAPKNPTKGAPKPAAPISGKPIWDKPHSS